MTSSRFIIGDVFDGLAALKAEGTQVDLVLTSPPFLALRSYLPPDHPNKGKEIGSEPTPAAFLSTMLDVVEACAEVLTPTGTLAFEFGDTYSGSGGAGGDYNEGGLRQGQNGFTGSSARSRHEQPRQWSGGNGWPLDKSMCMIPELFAGSLAYGRNLLDPERTTDPWRIRNTIAWVRPNPPVGALGDKFRPAKSLITIAAKARDRWFDLDAVRQPLSENTHARVAKGAAPRTDLPSQQRDGNWDTLPANNDANPLGSPPLDWWKISPSGYAGSHYAVYPPEVCRIPIDAMCPRRVCRTCGTPSRRESSTEQVGTRNTNGRKHGGSGTLTENLKKRTEAVVTTTGWTTCGCPGTDGVRIDGYHTGPGWRPGIVLDPFGGSGTTGLVANGLSRDAILLDLDERNADLARERLGMFVTVEHLADREDVA